MSPYASVPESGITVWPAGPDVACSVGISLGTTDTEGTTEKEGDGDALGDRLGRAAVPPEHATKSTVTAPATAARPQTDRIDSLYVPARSPGWRGRCLESPTSG